MGVKDENVGIRLTSTIIAMAEQQRQKFALITGCTPGGIG